MSEKPVHTKSTVERLKGMVAELGIRLAQERESHVVRLNTLATEAVDVQKQYIQVLESRVHELEAENETLRRGMGQTPTDLESA
jgi:hypothetical protein